MALDVSKLLADATIKAANLPESVLAAIATLSSNDEKITINTKVGETYGLIDNVVAEVTGAPIVPGTKTTEFVKTHLSALKAKADLAGTAEALKTERDALKTQVDDLNDQIRKGNGDAALKARVTELEGKLAQKDADIETLKTAKDAELTTLKTQIEKEAATNIDLAFKQAANEYFSTLSFDPKLPQWAIDAKKADVIAKVKEQKGTPTLVSDDSGVKKLVFKDAKGNVLNNPSNGLNPFGFADLAGEFIKDAIVTKTTTGGGGTTPPRTGSGATGGAIDLSSAKNKNEAMDLIREQVRSEGLSITVDPVAYQARFDELYASEGVEALPLK